MKVSVILPTYNRAKLLKSSLESLINLHPDEIIIINDSTDDTENVINELKSKINLKINLKIITHKKRVGSAKARNEAIKEAEGDLLFFTDDDHIYPDSTLLEKIKRIFTDNPIIGAIVLKEYKKGKKSTKVTFKKRFLMMLTEWIILELFQQKRGYVKYGSSAMIVKRSIMNRIKYDEGYIRNCWREESQLQLDIQKLNWKIYFDPSLYFQHIYVDYGGYRTISREKYHYWTIRNHTRFLKKNFPWKILPFFLLFLQANIRKGRAKEFIKAFKDGLKS